jgi:hypothetical protein
MLWLTFAKTSQKSNNLLMGTAKLWAFARTYPKEPIFTKYKCHERLQYQASAFLGFKF